MGLVYEVYLVEEGDTVLVARTYMPDKLLEAVKELLEYLLIWEGLEEGKQIKINIYEEPEEGAETHEA